MRSLIYICRIIYHHLILYGNIIFKFLQNVTLISSNLLLLNIGLVLTERNLTVILIFYDRNIEEKNIVTNLVIN